MSVLINRPKRGLSPEEALRRWSDPAQYEKLIALAGTETLPPINLCGNYIREPERCGEYRTIRMSLEAVFEEKLQEGAVLSSAIPEYAEAREVLSPSLWDLISIHYESGEAVGHDRTYLKPEFFELTEIPLNVRSIPDWLDNAIAASGLNVFRHDRDYRHVFLHGEEFALSDLHAKVVMLLHQAFLAGEPWQYGAAILEQAGSSQLKMSDAFKSREDWKKLIDSDGKGMYRLRMDRPDADSARQ